MPALQPQQPQPPTTPPIPPLQPVDSTHIASAAHDRITKTLYVSFHDSSVYAYHNVPEGAYQAMITNKSPGSFFNARIKGQFQAAKIKNAPPKQQPNLQS